MIKVCFWLNAPSYHQTLFLDELNKHKQVDILVHYFKKSTQDRLVLGWRNDNSLYSYEKYIENNGEILSILSAFKERIHIVIGYGFYFNQTLIPLIIENKIPWIHWSERYGILLAEKLNFNMKIFELLRPLYLQTKRSYGALVNTHAIGSFSQGLLAKKDFTSIGISNSKIADLYYTSSAIIRTNKIPLNFKNFKYKYKFLYVGKLCKRKGTSDLLKAFSILKDTSNWGLVLVGEDTSNGRYKKIAEKLDISKQILFVGAIDKSNLNKFYSNSDVFILPSRFDGWGTVVNEAASIGLPIIGSNESGASFHLIKNSINGYIFKAGNIKDLALSMQQYITNPSIIYRHGKASALLYQHFTPIKNVERFISAIRKWVSL